ncbi:MAG: ABC transporter ATP-binding protein [Pseudomonadota bacterium]
MTEAPGLHLEGNLSFGSGSSPLAVDLKIAPGEWTCLLGPSGVGKSTLLRTIAALPAGGEYVGTLGEDPTMLKGQVAYMAQDDGLAPWLNVTQNVCLGAKLRGEPADVERAATLIDQVGLSGDAFKKPRALSGGMRQRAALARTLMEDRSIVLLDEPFSALDAKNRAEMQELTYQALDGRTVLLVTHDPAEAVRLGHSIRLMGADQIEEVSPPAMPPLRDQSDPAVLAAGAALLNRLRGV